MRVPLDRHSAGLAMQRVALLRAAHRRANELLERDPDLRRTMSSRDDVAYIRAHGRSSIEIIAAACQRFADRPSLGSREFERSTGTPAESFRTIRYAELWTRVEAIASGLAHLKLVSPGEFVGFLGFGSVDYAVADIACLHRGAVSVPLQTTMAVEELRRIVVDSDVACLFCSQDQLALARDIVARNASVRSIVVMDCDPTDVVADVAALRDAREVLMLGQVEAQGIDDGPVPFGRVATDPDPLVLIIHTSGSTGKPKGTLYPEGRWANRLRTALEDFPMPLVSVCYTPMCHMLGRLVVYSGIVQGGLTHFVCKSDMSTLFEDVRLTRPTMLALIPRVSGMIYQHYQSELVRRGGRDPSSGDGLARTIMAEMRHTFLGDRLCRINVGAAPTAPQVLTFLEECFQVSVINAYGATELGLVTVNDRIVSGVRYKLADVPELGYRTDDKPYPRGELLVQSATRAPGYFKRPADTAFADEDGYVRSGDIVEERGPGHVVLIDRKQNILRLAQGEFVSMARLEELFVAKSPFIEQTYVYGNALRSYVLAVLVPNLHAVRIELSRENPDREAIKSLLRAEIDRIAQSAALPRHEVPRDFLVDLEPFSAENGLLTESNKPDRLALKTRYGQELEALYDGIEARQLQELGGLLRGKQASVAEKVAGALATTLGLSPGEIDLARARTSFVGLGGDSFSAVRFCSLLEDVLGASPPIGVVVDPSLSLAALSNRIEALVQRDQQVTFATVHGKGARYLRASDLLLERFFPHEWGIVRTRPIATSRQVVLLTGASGFLGRFLLLELLDRLAGSPDGRVVCLVRAVDADAAADRVRAGFAHGGDSELLHRFDALARSGRVRFLPGDLTEPRLGLSEVLYEELAASVDAIVHCGAHVNHALSYAQLFAPNVLGTAEVMKLAVRRRRKSLHFVSSLALAAGLRRRSPILEDEGAADLWPLRSAGGEASDYGQGYATSKWACELLFRDLEARGAVPVNVFRCGMILPHGQYLGQVNPTDVLTRLLCGVLDTGLAPRSFHAEPDGNRHFDGMPVEVVAAAISGIALQESEGFHTYHVSNPHHDGVSLDTFVDWMQSAGHPVLRVPDHSDWYERFRQRLQELGTSRERPSPLSIVHRWQSPSRGVMPELDASGFRRKLRELTRYDDVPRLDERYFRHCLRSIAAAYPSD